MGTNFDYYTKNKEFRKGVKNCEFTDTCKHKFCNQYVISNYDNREWCVHPKNLNKGGEK
jgi:hypothetical protein